VRAGRVAAGLDARGFSTGSRAGAGAPTADTSSATGVTGAAASGTSSTSTAADPVSGVGVGGMVWGTATVTGEGAAARAALASMPGISV
jgi:hypothetical protein